MKEKKEKKIESKFKQICNRYDQMGRMIASENTGGPTDFGISMNVGSSTIKREIEYMRKELAGQGVKIICDRKRKTYRTNIEGLITAEFRIVFKPKT